MFKESYVSPDAITVWYYAVFRIRIHYSFDPDPDAEFEA